MHVKASHSPGAVSPQHVLVTGGTGFIGRQLVARLLGQGHRVTVLTRRTSLPVAMAHARLRACQQLQDLDAAVPVDAVVNLAGARILGLPWTGARRATLVRSRVDLTQRLVDWIGGLARKPQVLVSASAIGYYGVQAPGDERALTEADPPQPVFMSELCRAWEEAAAGAVSHGVRVACLRFGLVLGHGGALPMLLLPVRLGVGGRLGSGQQWLSWVHIDDVLGAVAHAWQAGGPAGFRACNVTAPQQVTQLEFTRTAARVLHRPSFWATPAAPVRLLLGEQSDLLLQGQRVNPARLLGEGFEFRHPQLEGALRQITARL